MIETLPGRGSPRLLICTYHCYGDPFSGAALSLRDLAELLAARGWDCQALCGPHLDADRPVPLGEVLCETYGPIHEHQTRFGDVLLSLYLFAPNDVLVTAFDSPVAVRDGPPGQPEGQAFLSLFEKTLREVQPDLLVTYGGHWLAREVVTRAKSHGLPVIFWLRNDAYRHAETFRDVDGILVASQWVREYYRRTLGLECVGIPSPLNWARIRCDEVQGRFVTFVNPQANKGLVWMARLAAELGRQRADIPLLIVEGRGRADRLGQVGIDLSGLRTLSVMKQTPDPRAFYQVSRIILMPSFWQEAFGRVAAEALINGIPVLASRRGGLPETLAEAGFLFDIPDDYTPQATRVPTAAEVAPWVETICQLWDDPALYEQERQRCLAAAEAWRPERLAARYEEFFARFLR